MSKTDQGFSPTARLKSLSHALRGLVFLVRNEHNSWIHLAAAALVVTLGTALQIASADWLWLIAAIGWVWTAETMNTAVECVCDAVSPGHNRLIGRAKDVAAGAVLISAGAAALIGAIVLGPYMFAIG